MGCGMERISSMSYLERRGFEVGVYMAGKVAR